MVVNQQDPESNTIKFNGITLHKPLNDSELRSTSFSSNLQKTANSREKTLKSKEKTANSRGKPTKSREKTLKSREKTANSRE